MNSERMDEHPEYGPSPLGPALTVWLDLKAWQEHVARSLGMPPQLVLQPPTNAAAHQLDKARYVLRVNHPHIS